MADEYTEDRYNLTNFIQNSIILLISDFEGTTPTTHFSKFKEYCEKGQGSDQRVIFLGDIFDNTAQYNKKCTGEACEEPDAKDEKPCPSDANYVALQTLQLLVDNPDNCRYVVGNRDINKIKLLPFFSFKDGTKWWKEKKVVGESNVGGGLESEGQVVPFESYADIVTELLNRLEANGVEDDLWLVNNTNIKYFRPFWKNKINTEGSVKEIDTKGEKSYAKNKIWMKDAPGNINDIYERFELMFGRDADKGTMSALVSLKCIPNELFYDKDNKTQNIETEFFDKIVDTNKPGDADGLIKWKRKMRAALTIVVFMRMLDKELWRENTNDTMKELDKYSFNGIGGYLYHYLSQCPPAYYAEHKDNLLLFAHGGITEKFVEGGGGNEIDVYTKRKLADWERIIDNKVSGTTIQNGGTLSNNIICQSINHYNNVYFELVRIFFSPPDVLSRVSADFSAEIEKIKEKQNNYWKKAMLSLLDLSAGTKTNPNQVKEPYNQILDMYYPRGRIYNIYGHASSSAGYSFSKVAKSNKTYYINTDFSTTLYKAGISCDESYNANYLTLVLDTNEDKLKLTLEGKVIIKAYKMEQNPAGENVDTYTWITSYIKDNETLKIDEKLKKTYYIEKQIEGLENNTYVFAGEKNILDSLDDETGKPKFCDFNGIATIGEHNYKVFSTTYKVKGVNFIYFQAMDDKVTPEEIIAVNRIMTANVGGRRQQRKKQTQRKKQRKTLKKNKNKNKNNKQKHARKTKHKHARKTKRDSRRKR
jgi:hypothetical protein